MNRVSNTGVQGWGMGLVLYALFLGWVALAPPARRAAQRTPPTRVTLVERQPQETPVAPAPPPPPRRMETDRRPKAKSPPAPAPLLETPASPAAPQAATPPVAAPRRFAVSMEATIPGGGVAVPTAQPGQAPALRATPGGTSDRPDAPAFVREPDAAPALLEQPSVGEMRALYPEGARRTGLEADVRLELEISATGEVTGSRVLRSGGNGFDEAAQKLVRRFRFRPAVRAGRPVPATIPWTYKFRLEG